MDKTTGCNFMNKNVLLSIHSIHVKKSKLLQILVVTNLHINMYLYERIFPILKLLHVSWNNFCFKNTALYLIKNIVRYIHSMHMWYYSSSNTCT